MGTPATEIKEWVELLTKQPLIPVMLGWGIIELRRFLSVMVKHMETEEKILTEIRDGLILDLRGHMHSEETALTEIRDRLRPRRPPPAS